MDNEKLWVGSVNGTSLPGASRNAKKTADIAAAVRQFIEHGERMNQTQHAGGEITPDHWATLFQLSDKVRGALAALKDNAQGIDLAGTADVRRFDDQCVGAVAPVLRP